MQTIKKKVMFTKSKTNKFSLEVSVQTFLFMTHSPFFPLIHTKHRPKNCSKDLLFHTLSDIWPFFSSSHWTNALDFKTIIMLVMKRSIWVYPCMTPVKWVEAAVLMLTKYFLIMDIFSSFPLNWQRLSLLSLLPPSGNPFFTKGYFPGYKMGTWLLIREGVSSWGSGSEDMKGKKSDMKPWLGLWLSFLYYFSLGPNSFPLACWVFSILIFLSKWIIMSAGSSGNTWPNSVYNMSLKL